jgi:hypothetical protein
MGLKYLLCFTTVLFLGSCGSLSTAEEESGPKIVAKAGSENLDMNEFRDYFLSSGSVKDSAYLSKRAIDNWATESLFYQEALSKLNEDEVQIEKEVEKYKKSLVNYIYQTKIIEANLDTNVAREEIEEYYNAHRDNFILKENIVKVNYFKIPLKAQGLDKIRRLLYAANPKDAELLKNLCAQNAENFFMNDSTWLFLEEIKKEIPKLRDQPDLALVPGRVLEFSDDPYYYYLRVKDIKIKNGLSPINFERQNIKTFIINNRKVQIIREYKQLLLEKAKADKSFVGY